MSPGTNSDREAMMVRTRRGSLIDTRNMISLWVCSVELPCGAVRPMSDHDQNTGRMTMIFSEIVPAFLDSDG